MNISSGIKRALFLLVCGSCTVFAFAADTISGTVRNQTTGEAAPGDEVILLRLKNGMEEPAARFSILIRPIIPRRRSRNQGHTTLRFQSRRKPRWIRLW